MYVSRFFTFVLVFAVSLGCSSFASAALTIEVFTGLNPGVGDTPVLTIVDGDSNDEEASTSGLVQFDPDDLTIGGVDFSTFEIVAERYPDSEGTASIVNSLTGFSLNVLASDDIDLTFRITGDNFKFDGPSPAFLNLVLTEMGNVDLVNATITVGGWSQTFAGPPGEPDLSVDYVLPVPTLDTNVNYTLVNQFSVSITQGFVGSASSTAVVHSPEPASLAIWSVLGLVGAAGAYRVRRNVVDA